jgi:hypothetical protein
MICPFCQHDLDVEEALCPHCAAALPRHPGMPFRVKMRTLAIGGMMMFTASLILVECVLDDIQSQTIVPQCSTFSTGGNCEIRTTTLFLSPQGSQFGGPDLKGYDLQQLLLQWQQYEQPTQNNPYTLPKKTPSR